MREPLPAEMFDELCPSSLEPMAVACTWAEEHWDELLNAQESYDNASHLGHAG